MQGTSECGEKALFSPILCSCVVLILRLGNTPAVCRKCYVHPAVLDAYMEGAVIEALRERTEQQLIDDLHALQPEEAAVLAMLQQRLQHDADAAEKKAA